MRTDTLSKAAKAVKKFKLLLENGDKRMRVQVNEEGEFS